MLQKRSQARHLKDQKQLDLIADHEGACNNVQTLKEDGFVRRWLDMYANWSMRLEISQDVPFNRFIQYTFSYFIFLALLILLIINQASEREYDKIVHWSIYHSMIFLWIGSMLVADLFIFARLRMNAFSNFWRVYDLLFHILLLSYLDADLILCAIDNNYFGAASQHHPGKNESQSNIAHDLAIGFESKERQAISAISNIMFALGKL